MCGIGGFQGGFDPALLDSINAALAARGPDGEGTWLSEPAADGSRVGLAHRRLAIIDLSDAGAQPMGLRCQACGAHSLEELALTFNGEIYNYRELRADLEARGHRFYSNSDSEVLLHCYGHEGPAMLGRLNGIFAFAIRDGRMRRPAGMEKGDVLLARDHVGVKPLYVATCPSGVVFASEIKAILREASVSREIDATALHETLAYLWTPAPRTILRDVRKLEPGEAMILGGGRVRRQWSYFAPGYDGRTSSRSRRELGEELASRVRAAVRRQLVSDVPVGAFLSGGLDSSAVVAMMREVNPGEPITCFTISFTGDTVEGNPLDLPYARRVARHLAVDLVELEINPGIIDRLEEMVCLMDEPQADPAPLNALVISERSRELGIKVLLSGAGGDDLFGGYRRHWAVHTEPYWRWLPRPARRGLQELAQGAARGGAGGQHRTIVRRATKLFTHAAEEGDRRLITYFWWATESVRRGLYSPAFAEQVRGADTAAPLLRSLERIPSEQNALQRMLMLELRHFLPDHNLNYTDRAGMAAGVEIRVPLLDLELVDLATAIPASLKQRGRTGKALFKQAMEPYLPREVIYRGKSGFGAPLRRWLRNELRETIADVLSPQAIRSRGIFDPDAVSRLVQQDRDGAIDGGYTIFSLMCLEYWFRNFIDRPAAEAGRR